MACIIMLYHQNISRVLKNVWSWLSTTSEKSLHINCISKQTTTWFVWCVRILVALEPNTETHSYSLRYRELVKTYIVLSITGIYLPVDNEYIKLQHASLMKIYFWFDAVWSIHNNELTIHIFVQNKLCKTCLKI